MPGDTSRLGPEAALNSDAPEGPDYAPASITRQVLQLVLIPAIITITAIGVAALFGLLAGRQDSLEDQLNRLRQSSGAGRMAFGIQDPRYKDRSLAAHNLALMLPQLEDPEARARVSNELVDILQHHVGPQEDQLQAYMLLALGQLGQDSALDVVLAHGASEHATVRQAVTLAVASWPEGRGARRAIDMLLALLEDPSVEVAASAVRTLGMLITPEDREVLDSIRRAMANSGPQRRDVYWNAAIALARAHDPEGSAFVARVLLDRAALSRLPAPSARGPADRLLSADEQDRVLLLTLAAATIMPAPVIHDKVRQIADKDPNLTVRKTAAHLLGHWGRRGQGTRPADAMPPAPLR